ncbi:MAG: DMT family transporter, partial [Bacteroidales bacterium]
MKKFKGFGLLLAIISSATFGFIPLFSIPLLNGGIELDSVCFYRFFFSSIMMGLFMLYKKVSFKVTLREFITVFLLSIFYASTSIFLTASYAYMPSGISTTIHFLYPVLVATMMILFFKEKLSVKKTMAIMVAIAGVFFLCGGISGAASNNAVNAT